MEFIYKKEKKKDKKIKQLLGWSEDLRAERLKDRQAGQLEEQRAGWFEG